MGQVRRSLAELKVSLTDAIIVSSTRGLDASTALEFVRALRIATDSCRLSTIVSIYQAGESLYQHFDKVCVLYVSCLSHVLLSPADVTATVGREDGVLRSG